MLVDGGIVGVVIGILGVFVLSRYLCVFGMPASFCVLNVYALSVLGVYLFVAAVFDWPTGAWLLSVFPLLFVGKGYEDEPMMGGRSSDLAPSKGHVEWIARFSFVLFLILQVPFVASRQVLLMPEWLTNVAGG